MGKLKVSLFSRRYGIVKYANRKLNFARVYYNIKIFIADDDNALVHGIITQNGLFEGTILTPTEEFHIEPVSRYFNATTTKEPTFHSIIYKANDVKDPREGSACASHRLYEKNLLEDERNDHQNHRREKRYNDYNYDEYQFLECFV